MPTYIESATALSDSVRTCHGMVVLLQYDYYGIGWLFLCTYLLLPKAYAADMFLRS